MSTLTMTCPLNGAVADGLTANTLNITLVDSSGVAVSGQAITLTATSGATLSASSVTTDANGAATANVASGTKGSYTVTAASSGATSVSTTVIFTDSYEAAAGNRAVSEIKTALEGTNGPNYIGYDSTVDYTAGTIGAALNNGQTELTTQGDKLARYIDIEDYADANSAAGDWTTALQAAFDASNTLGIYDVRGTGSYAVSNTVYIRAVPSWGLKVSIYKLGVTSSFPVNTTFWDATAIIAVGQDSGNINGLELSINYLDGGSIANGIAGVAKGFGTSHLHIGFATNCISVVRMGAQEFNSASNKLSGHYWVNNWLGAFISNGTGTDVTIVEGWVIDVDFIANNYWGGAWFFNAGQYAKIRGDWDFNGRYLGVITLSDTTGLTSISGQTGLKLTDGTTEMEFLFYYTDQGSTYAVVAASKDISISGAAGVPWAAGSTISCTTVTGVALVFSASQTAGDNGNGTNFFDILHDFERTSFGKIQVVAGYLSGIIGGSLFSSSFQYQNAFSGQTDSIRGFGVSNSGSTLAMYNYALSELPFANITADFVNFENKLYMKDWLYEGIPSANTIASSTSETSTLAVLSNSANNKYLGEGCMYDVTLKTNYAACAAFRIYVINAGDSYSHSVVSSFIDSAIAVTFNDTSDGVEVNFRQEAQTTMDVVVNTFRV